MVAAYFGKGYNGHDIFYGLAIGANPEYEKYLNGHYSI